MTTKQIQCYGCSVLCDDVYVELDENGKLITTINSCFRGNSFIKNYLSENRLHKSIQKQMGLEIFLDFDETFSLLKNEISEAQSIKFYGLGALSYEDQLSVLCKIRQLVDTKEIFIDGIENASESSLLPSQSTIGQGINNADVFILWDCDPTHSHPKLFGKLLFSRGLFRLSGKEMKKFIMIQKQDSDLTRLKDILIDFSEQSVSQLIKELSKLLNNEPLEKISIGKLAIENLRTLKTFLQATEYGLIVCATPIREHVSVPEMNLLIRKLNENVKGRFAFMSLTPKSNDLGLYSALTKVFGKGMQILKSNSNIADLAIIFGGEYLRDEYNPHKIEYQEKKIVLFDNFKSTFSKKAFITIPYAVPGIECQGTAIRMDGINVDLKKWVTPEEEIKTIKEIFRNLSF